MYDILYFDFEGHNAWFQAQEDLKKLLPGAIIEDGSDEIHGYRLTVETPEWHDDTSYYQWLLNEGLFGKSFAVALARETGIISDALKAVIKSKTH